MRYVNKLETHLLYKIAGSAFHWRITLIPQIVLRDDSRYGDALGVQLCAI